MIWPLQSDGTRGEALAARDYRRDGYTILGRNFHTRFGEIDVIARKGDWLVFCEVKTRAEGAVYTPAEAVTPAKQRRVIASAQIYMAQTRLAGLNVRFDVVEVTKRRGAWRTNRIENAFTL